MEITAQIFGIIAMACFILSFQFKKGTLIIFSQLIGTVFYSLQYAFLSAINHTIYIGLFINILSIFRAWVYYKKEFFHADHIFWLIFFISSFLICYVLLFTCFKVEANATNLILESLPVLANIMTTVGYKGQNAKRIRVLSMIASVPWGVYHFTHASIGGTIGEVVNFLSTLIGMIRHDIKKNKTEN